MYKPLVSVIVNTCNRGNHLKRLLDCLMYQSYDLFEVVVVNGPSDDNTNEILEAYGSSVRVASCAENNLCKSRNIGIREAAGEILAFIDDDAVPMKNTWLENIVKPFENSAVGVAGGATRRFNGDIEFQYGICSILGRGSCNQNVPTLYEDHQEGFYNHARGNNLIVRRAAAVDVGGFDEYYSYFLDESDLCIRLQNAGYKFRYIENAEVLHEGAKGDNRKDQYHLNWKVISQSQGYFNMKFTENLAYSLEERKQTAWQAADVWFKEFEKWYGNNEINQKDYEMFQQMVTAGIRQGIADALSMPRKINAAFGAQGKRESHIPFKNADLKRLNICLVCEDNPVKSTGGVAVYTKELCLGFVKRGHNVYVITRGKQCRIDCIDGINVCSVDESLINIERMSGMPVTSVNVSFAYKVFEVLQTLKKSFYVNIVEAPIWDAQGMVIAHLEKEIPVVTRLQTPLKMMMETFQMQSNGDLEMMMECEALTMNESDAIITISDCVRDTIEDLYAFKFELPVYKNYLGFDINALCKSDRNDDGRIIIFFCGRLERRKGIDSIFEMLPPLLDEFDNVEFRFAGNNEIYDEIIKDTYEDWFEKKYSSREWYGRVKFLGTISDKRKELEYANCDIFIAPSLYESFGIIFLEAMKYSKPVIGCKIGGMQEIIVDGETGYLAAPGDAAGLYTCLKKLIMDPQQRIAMGQAGRRRVEAVFNSEAMCEGTLDIYSRVLTDYGKREEFFGQ